MLQLDGAEDSSLVRRLRDRFGWYDQHRKLFLVLSEASAHWLVVEANYSQSN